MIVSLTAQNTNLMFSVSIEVIQLVVARVSNKSKNVRLKVINEIEIKSNQLTLTIFCRSIIQTHKNQRGNQVNNSHYSEMHATDNLFTCSTCEMRINNFLRVRIQIYEHTQYEFSGGYGISLGSCGI